MQGNLSQITLNDILLLATGARKSGVLKLSRGKENVEVFLLDGNIVHATCPIGVGEKALLYPVTWGEGTFTLVPNGTPPATTIKKTSEQLLDEVKAMSREWETILDVIPSGKTIFRIADLDDDEQTGPITIPHVGWRVLSKVNGSRSVQEISEILRIPYAYAAKVVFNLHNSRLVEVVEASAQDNDDLVPPALLNRLSDILDEILGPKKNIVLQDQIASLEESQDSFPDARLDELIASVSGKISNPKLKRKFEDAAHQEISNFKKF